MTETRPKDRRQYVALGALPLAVTGLTGILSLSRGAAFEPYFGGIPPLAAIAAVILAGAASLWFLRSRGWFEIYSTGSFRGTAVAATVATLFGIVQVFVDLAIRFPRDLNVPPPRSLAFYPVMACVVEVLFHALPLSLLLAVLGSLPRKVSANVLVWMCFVVVSCLEPILMIRLGFSAYVGMFVFVFNLFQLYVFRRYDFLSMFSFRCVYYLEWHVIWGYWRLRLLF